MAFAAFGSSGAAAEPAPLRRGGRTALLLLIPGLAYLALFFLTPLVSLLLTSLYVPGDGGGIGNYVPGLAFSNYWEGISTYWVEFVRSFAYALAATVIALLISYPIAYFIGVTARKWPLVQALALTLVIAPFFISFLLRTLAWKQLLADNTPFVQFLKTVGIIPPNGHFLTTDYSVVFGLIYNFIPFMVLPIYVALERLDTRYLEAGSDLYAGPATTFRKVTLPLSMSGVVSGTLLTFIPISGDFINASQSFLGGPNTKMVGNVIEQNFLDAQNFPLAAVLSVLLMAVIVVIVAVYVRRTGTEDLL